jgi:hypothetical protein
LRCSIVNALFYRLIVNALFYRQCVVLLSLRAQRSNLNIHVKATLHLTAAALMNNFAAFREIASLRSQ